MESQWSEMPFSAIPVLGCTAAVISDKVFVIGGLPAGSSHTNYLSVRYFDSATAKPGAFQINSCGVLNRAYHAIAIDESVGADVFGGEAPDGSLIGDAVRCSVGDEGFTSKTIRRDIPARKGMASGRLGPQGGLTLLFGGTDGKIYFNDIYVMKGDPASSTTAIETIALEGDKPPARAHCSYSVCGSNKQYLVLSGGFDGRKPLDDIWVLDATKCIPELNKVEAEAVPAGGKPAAAKGGKGAAVVEEVLKWTRVPRQLEPARFLHSSYITKRGENSCSVVISGGMSSRGPLSVAPTAINLTLADGGSVSDSSRSVSSSAHDADIPKRYGSSAVSVCANNGTAIAAFLFGGLTVGDALISIIDESADFSVQILSAVASNRSLREKQERILLGVPEVDQSDEQTDSRVQLTLPSGDSYFGEVYPESELPHGYGVMSYADGSRYEVTTYMYMYVCIFICTYKHTYITLCLCVLC